MKILVQRVKNSSVLIDGDLFSFIGKGMLVFIGVEKGDTKDKAEFLANKLSNFRIFEDEFDKMNLSIQDIKGDVLVVSQFTLAGDTTRGNRPGFESAAKPGDAKFLYEYFIELLKNKELNVQTGVFQANMQVELTNDGPVTFMLEK